VNSASPYTTGCIQESYSLRQNYRLEASNLAILHDDDNDDDDDHHVYLSVTIDKVSIILFNDAINLHGYTPSVVDGMNKAMSHLYNNN